MATFQNLINLQHIKALLINYTTIYYQIKRDFSVGITAKKDRRNIFKSPRTGFDYYSAHAYINLDRFVREVAVGDTRGFSKRFNCGYGLISGKNSRAVSIA